VAFLSILEPIWGIILAHLYLEEVVPHTIYLGGALILAAAFLHLWSTSGKKIRIKKALRRGSFGEPYHLKSSKVS
jgi:drug/metabolite transporter (DMT)-like permease